MPSYINVANFFGAFLFMKKILLKSKPFITFFRRSKINIRIAKVKLIKHKLN